MSGGWVRTPLPGGSLHVTGPLLPQTALLSWVCRTEHRLVVMVEFPGSGPGKALTIKSVRAP